MTSPKQLLPLEPEWEFSVGRVAGVNWSVVHHDDLVWLQFLEPSPGERPQLVTIYLNEFEVLEFRLALRELLRSLGPSSESSVH